MVTNKQGARCQFDVVYGWLQKNYVECKYRSQNKPVSFEQVSTFAGKLYLIGESYRRGTMITNSRYSKRARIYAQKIGLHLINGDGLKDLEWDSKGLIAQIASFTK